MKDEIEIPRRLVFFEGCTTARALPETRLATYILLEKAVDAGIIKEYKIIPNERCCGYASMVIGDFKTQHDNLIFNLNALTRTGIDDVLFTCGACTQFLGNDPEFRRRGFRSINIIEFLYALARRSDLEKLIGRKLPEGTKITGHYSCHLERLAGVRLERLYRGIAGALGAEYVEMKDASDCCGAGSEGKVAMAIAGKKIENADNSKADLVPLACAGCEAMLAVASKQHKSRVKVVSLSSLVVSCFDDLDRWVEKLGGALKEPTPKDAPSAVERTLESIGKPAAAEEPKVVGSKPVSEAAKPEEKEAGIGKPALKEESKAAESKPVSEAGKVGEKKEDVRESAVKEEPKVVGSKPASEAAKPEEKKGGIGKSALKEESKVVGSKPVSEAEKPKEKKETDKK